MGENTAGRMRAETENRGKRKIRTRGFTLVELIVVLVILGILAAIMVPSLIGWIDKAKNQDAILECRAVVVAAQGQVVEIYGKDSSRVETALNESDSLENIKKLAKVEGTLYNTIKLQNYTVSYLEYKTSKKIDVVYDIGKNPSYQIKTDSNGNRSTNGKEHYDSLVDKLYDDKFITKQENSEIAKITEDLRRKVANSVDNRNEKNENVSRVLQDYFMNNVGDGEYPAVTEEEKEFIKNAVGNYKESDNTLDGASWRPIVATGGEVIMVAAKGNDYGNAKNASVIYYNGKYYAWTHSYDGRFTTCTVGDGAVAKFDVAKLTESGSLWKELN